jgi:hypothetical protein
MAWFPLIGFLLAFWFLDFLVRNRADITLPA